VSHSSIGHDFYPHTERRGRISSPLSDSTRNSVSLAKNSKIKEKKVKK